MHKEITLTDNEKKILFGTDEQEDPTIDQGDADEEEVRFDKFKVDFFKALQKLRKMQDIHALLVSE